MSHAAAKSAATLPWVLSLVLMALGVLLFVVYLLYLVVPEWFSNDQFGDPGLIFYCLATAGAALLAWGKILSSLLGDSVSKAVVMKASALGMLMLGVMRLGTAVFPHAPFESMIYLPLTEAVIFSFIAWRLFQA